MSSKSEIFNDRSSLTNLITQEMVEVVASAMNPYWFEDNAVGEFPEQVEQKRRLWRSYAKKGINAVYPLIRHQILMEQETESEKWGHYLDNPASKLRSLKEVPNSKS